MMQGAQHALVSVISEERGGGGEITEEKGEEPRSQLLPKGQELE